LECFVPLVSLLAAALAPSLERLVPRVFVKLTDLREPLRAAANLALNELCKVWACATPLPADMYLCLSTQICGSDFSFHIYALAFCHHTLLCLTPLIPYLPKFPSSCLLPVSTLTT
jgi:hypothetical protein